MRSKLRVNIERPQGFRRNLSMVVSVILVTFISLTFFGAAILLQTQISQTKGYWYDRAQVAVYLCSDYDTEANCNETEATTSQKEAVQAELEGETWVAPPIGWSCDEVFMAGCRTAGFSPKIAHRAGDWQATMGLVAGGLGISLVPRLAHTAPPPGVVIVPLLGAPPQRHVFAACRAGAESSPAIRVVLDALGSVARAQVPLVRAA